MKNLFITSINPGVGKTTFITALGLKLRKEGFNVGYFKPIADSSQDTDAKDAIELLGLDDEMSEVCPTVVSSYEYDMTNEYKSKIIDEIMSSYQALNSKYDFLLIEGCKKVNYLAFLDLSTLELADKLDSKVLLVSSGEEVEDVDRLILGKKYLEGIDVVGAVFTLVPDQLFDLFKSSICPRLETNEKIHVFGLIPNRANLVAPSVFEIQSILNAEVIAGKDHMHQLVENYVVGAMQTEYALKYFRRSLRKAVITGGDRPEIALAAMETDTSCLILTGSIHPPAPVLARAEEKDIPVLSVTQDTFNTVKKLTESHFYGKIHQEQTEKISAWEEIFIDVDYNSILDKL